MLGSGAEKMVSDVRFQVSGDIGFQASGFRTYTVSGVRQHGYDRKELIL